MGNIILVKGITCILTHFLLCLTFKLRKRSKILFWDKLAGSKCFLCISYLVSLRCDCFFTQRWQSRELIPLTFPFSFSFSRAGVGGGGGVMDIVSSPSPQQCGSSFHQDLMTWVFHSVLCAFSSLASSNLSKNVLLHKKPDLILERFKLINGLYCWGMPLLSWCAIPKVVSTVCSSPAFVFSYSARKEFPKILEKLLLRTSELDES